jgi:hypothetical protein
MAVVMTAHRRPYYLCQALESWQATDGMTELAGFHVALDASDRTQQMAGLLNSYSFASWTLNLPPRGSQVNPVQAIAELFARHPEVSFAVLAEEDLLVSADVLTFMSWAADEFRDDQHVLTVCAHPGRDGTDPELAFFTEGFSPWIWGTWRDRWDSVICPTWDRNYSTGDAECPQSGWDWNLNKRIIPRGGYVSVAPDITRSQNIGEHEGVHALPADFPGTVLASFRQDSHAGKFRLAR